MRVPLTIRPGAFGTAAASAAIASAGGVVTGGYAGLLTVDVPLKALAGLAADPRVGWIGTAPDPVVEVTGQGWPSWTPTTGMLPDSPEPVSPSPSSTPDSTATKPSSMARPSVGHHPELLRRWQFLRPDG